MTRKVITRDGTKIVEQIGELFSLSGFWFFCDERGRVCEMTTGYALPSFIETPEEAQRFANNHDIKIAVKRAQHDQVPLNEF